MYQNDLVFIVKRYMTGNDQAKCDAHSDHDDSLPIITILPATPSVFHSLCIRHIKVILKAEHIVLLSGVKKLAIIMETFQDVES